MQIPTGRIMKAPDFATSQDEATNCVRIARFVFEAVPKMDRARFNGFGVVEPAIIDSQAARSLLGASDSVLELGRRGRLHQRLRQQADTGNNQ